MTLVNSSRTIQSQLAWAGGKLARSSDSPALDSEVLLAFCLQKSRTYLISWPERELSDEQLQAYRQLINKRLQPQPVAYLTGCREFYSMELKTTPATLVPRPETELLVDCVLDRVQTMDNARILELGTGTGAIALAIKKHAPHCTVLATDVCEQALEVARENASTHQLQVDFLLSNWYQALDTEKYDIIVSNPPYIAADDPYLQEGDLPAEPMQALCSGDSGLEAIDMIIEGADAFLNPQGMVLLEHGFEQAEAVSALFRLRGFGAIQTWHDLSDLPRVTGALGNT